jgi:hypothetical protein
VTPGIAAPAKPSKKSVLSANTVDIRLFCRHNHMLGLMRHALSAAIAAFTALAATAAEQAKITNITLERTTCYGTCPAYRLALHPDGSVYYEGKDYVREKGRRTGRIAPEAFQKIAVKVAAIRFFDLHDEYNSQEINGATTFVTDQPTTITTVTRGGQTKKIENYFGGPKRLYELEQLIDQLTESYKWVGGDARANKDVPYYDSFPLHRVMTFRALLEGASTSYADATAKPKKVSKYILMFVNNSMSFDLRAPASINLPAFDGYIVDATGALEEDQRTRGLIFHVSKVRPIRRYSASE